MFGMEKKKEVREGLLEKLIDHLMAAPDAKSEEGEDVAVDPEAAKVEVMELEVKPKKKFKLADGSEQEDESLEEILERQKKKKLEV